MNILILNYEFPPLGGGAANATFYLLKEFAKEKSLTIDLVTSSTSSFKKNNFSDNIVIHYLNIGKKDSLHHQSNQNLLSYSWKAYQYVRKLKRNQHFDLVHAFFGIPCGFIAMQLGLPYIVSLRGSDVPFHNPKYAFLDKFFFGRLSKKVWKNSKATIANSSGLRQTALLTNPKQEIDIIYNGVDANKFCLSTNKPLNSSISLISTGRLSAIKGYKYLLKAMQSLENVKLTLIGDGPVREQLENLAKELAVEVRFLGRLPQEELIKHLQKADIFVLPSINESMSNSLLEAMACGIAVIVTNVGGSQDLVKECGFIVDRESDSALKVALQHYLEQPDLIKEHGLESRKIAEQMSWKSISTAYLSVYKKFGIKTDLTLET